MQPAAMRRDAQADVVLIERIAGKDNQARPFLQGHGIFGVFNLAAAHSQAAVYIDAMPQLFTPLQVGVPNGQIKGIINP